METRFNTDGARIQKRLYESTFLGRYMLDTPGQGINMPFQEDTQIRLQKYGANMYTDRINLENDLRCANRILSRDHHFLNDYKQKQSCDSRPIDYPSAAPFVDESRSTLPAWQFREFDITTLQMDYPLENPQQYLEIPFVKNVDTKMMEKDNFVRKPISRHY